MIPFDPLFTEALDAEFLFHTSWGEDALDGGHSFGVRPESLFFDDPLDEPCPFDDWP